jgi:plasmid maintenance system antidote protein VapI
MKLTSKDTLRALVRQKGVSYADLGQAAGCHKSMISALVNGHRTSCTTELAERIALVLGVPSEVLFVPHASAGSVNHDKRRARTAA